MKYPSFAIIFLLASLGYINPVKAEPQPFIPSQTVISASPTKAEILDACVRNQAETLPNPYSDVEPTHWAYKAVLSLYYCGAFRQATPPNLTVTSDQLLQLSVISYQ
ncbi:S-layer protein [Limnoraphis robusta]|uniref:S-layer protein n=1 Tax=Limnoraphis robusta TaxID=1118279 RepID=UPI002B1FD11C|nr:S-layer protein [Limnoraphis robusta]MEA5500336.1 S-layer protein [Limnoraphis robusta BA-68 BA1]